MSRTLVRYTIPLDSAAGPAHRLGINSLAIDPTNSGTLYSAGRDGIVAAWDLHMSLSRAPHKYDSNRDEVQVDSIGGDASYKTGLQAHTHWVNQIAISADYQSVYSCSSDTSIKCWRPNAFSNDKAESVGSHGDYVKSLIVPPHTKEWIATAGLDRSIILWDTNGKGERMRIDHHSPDGGMKQSIYSLVSGPNLLASGGIEKVIRVWDARSASRVTKFIGHTDNVRALLCSEDGKYFVSASSDTTIKIWDLAAGRCLHTLTTHSEPIWTLLSDHPQLAVFHAADKSGLVSKTDLRPQAIGEETRETAAVCKEGSGVNALAQIDGHLFTATSSSSINRWKDIETTPSDPFADEPGDSLARIESHGTAASARQAGALRRSSSVQQHKRPTKFVLGAQQNSATNGTNGTRPTSIFPQASAVSLGPNDEKSLVALPGNLEPVRTRPEAVILGQAGLQAHCMLSDRRRVLTTDSEGYVKLWDITQCKQIQDFGKIDIEEAETRLQSTSAVGSWCSVNTRVGALTVEMDPRNLLDAELYFDAIYSEEEMDFETRNQRFNLGKWILQGLFTGIIQAEKARDARELARLKTRRPGRLNLGDLTPSMHHLDDAGSETPRSGMRTPSFGSRNPYSSSMTSTPGTSVGLTTPAATYNPRPNGFNHHQAHGSMSSLGSNKEAASSPTTPGDYFSGAHGAKDTDATPTAAESQSPANTLAKTPGGSSLMKNMKWLRSSKASKAGDPKKVETPSASTLNSAVHTPVRKSDEAPKNFREYVDRKRREFVEFSGISQDSTATTTASSTTSTSKPDTWIQPLEPMPDLSVPSNVGLSLAIFQPGEGEAKDIYRGTVGCIGTELDTVTPFLPVWLAQILLVNEVPATMQNTESNKHYFSFVPHPSSSLSDPFNNNNTSSTSTAPSTPSSPSPNSSSNGNGNSATQMSHLMRLGAARSLRIRKALTYISQRLPPELVKREGGGRHEEEWLEIWVGGQKVDPDWTLMMVRRHLWKHGGDMRLEYKMKRE